MEKVAIIGMGISGMGVLHAYEKELKPGTVEIDCYDKDFSFGRGYPFRVDSDEILVNIPRERITYDYENLDDFNNWLIKNSETNEEYVPRNLFGTYTKELLQDSIKNIGAKVITEEVLDLEWIEDKKSWKLTTASGERIYDRIHYCAGELPQANHYNLDGTKNYYQDIYPAIEQLKDIKKDSIIAIVGTSLSAVDIARFLLVEKEPKKIYMFSRGNSIPSMRQKRIELKVKNLTIENLNKIAEKNKGHISYEEFDELLEADAKDYKIDFMKVLKKYSDGTSGLELSLNKEEDLQYAQSLLAHTTSAFNRAWHGFDELDREKYKEKYSDLLQIIGAPLPLPTGEIIVDAIRNDKFELVDDIVDVGYSENEGRFYLLREDEKLNSVKRKADYVLNATGLDMSLESVDRENSLLGKMLNKRYLQADKYGGVTVLPTTLCAVSPKYGTFSNLHVHGVLISGVVIRNNSTSVIQRTAHELIKLLYK